MGAGRPKKVEPEIQQPAVQKVEPTIQEAPATIARAIPITSSISYPQHDDDQVWVRNINKGSSFQMRRAQAIKWCGKYPKEYQLMF